MSSSIRSELFFLKQYGFSSKFLEYIFVSGVDVIPSIFNPMDKNLLKYATKKDLALSKNKDKYYIFKLKLYNKDPFLQKNKDNKIFFKYDKSILNDLMPYDIRPLFMYAKGNYELLRGNLKVAIIGTRNPKDRSINIAKKIVTKYVHKNYLTVSGLAKGIDTVVHEQTINEGGRTIAVLPTNFNRIYPKSNGKLAVNIERNGLLLSAIGPNEITYKSSFLERNKYVANISDVIVVIETNLNSGTMNTIRNAYEANKKILFVDQLDEQINNKIKEYNGEMLNE
ncbi:DNA-processing protein DprA [Companilactobacillus paralimentarius]|uniref:DNA-processing protein DprA n=1 Tax=Companilactobacillus paralimentarius TaxID=83526 RepID=UPI0037DFFEF1